MPPAQCGILGTIRRSPATVAVLLPLSPYKCLIKCLMWIGSCDVAFEMLDRLLLVRDDPLHKIANRDYSDDRLVFQDRQMPATVLGHQRHAVINRVAPRDKHD